MSTFQWIQLNITKKETLPQLWIKYSMMQYKRNIFELYAGNELTLNDFIYSPGNGYCSCSIPTNFGIFEKSLFRSVIYDYAIHLAAAISVGKEPTDRSSATF